MIVHDFDIVPEASDYWLAGRWSWRRMIGWYE